jgi:3-oxoadipate enol-lactonase / 4-carboxymuconolactone decarboxylase
VPAAEHEGARIHYETAGPPGAPVLVLANSLGTTTGMWDGQVAALSQRFLVVRYDHRGHGRSSVTPGPYTMALLAGDCLAVLDDLGAERASLVGLSIGGAVAMWVASHAPGRVEGLVLCCTAPAFPPPEQWADRAALVRRAGVAQLLDALMGRWFSAAFDDRDGAVRRHVDAMLRSVEPEGYAGCCEALAAMDQTADLAAIEAPTLVIGGAADPVVPPAAAVDLSTRITDASLLVLAGAAHLANIEQPARFNEAVISHLAGPAAERGDRVRRTVLGDEHVERAAAGAGELSAGFVDLVERVAWGEVWTRPGLDRATRSCITVAMLVALGRVDELELHLRGALRNGVTRAQIAEVLLQTAIYCGFPAANSAFAAARRALAEHGD